jgi:hypothetical protein
MSLVTLLAEDDLRGIAARVDPDTHYALALTCRAMRDAVAATGAVDEPTIKTKTTYASIVRGSVAIVKWALDEAGASLESLATAAVKRMPVRLEVLVFLHETRGARLLDVCAYAAACGDVAVLRWARERDFHWDERACVKAASGGHLETLRWARENGCIWDDRLVCSEAALGGHLEVLQWVRANGGEWDRRVCSMAAFGGHLALLQWAHANGCPWGWQVCEKAALCGHLEVLQWARAHDCPWNAWTCFSAARCGHLHVLQWARANGCAWDTPGVLDWLRFGRSDVDGAIERWVRAQ